MKLMHQRFSKGNFGDDLNPWLWPRLLPGVFDDNESVQFSGIGSWLHPGKIMSRDCRYVILGTGAGYTAMRFSLGRRFPWEMTNIEHYIRRHGPLPDGWERRNTRIYCVRGPLTAHVLGLDASLAVSDPAILVSRYAPTGVNSSNGVSFMPHHRTAELADFEPVCRELGVAFIDPRSDVDDVLRRILSSRVLITEALHGAIAADALRVPWVPVASSPWILPFKWQDYCQAMGLPYAPVRLRPIWKVDAIIRSAVAHGRASWISLIRARAWWDSRRGGDAVEAFARALNVPPVLSSERVLRRATERLEEIVSCFGRDVKAGDWDHRVGCVCDRTGGAA